MKFIACVAAALCWCGTVSLAQQGNELGPGDKNVQAESASDTGLKMVNGISYRITKHPGGKKVQVGDIISFNLMAQVDGYELGNTYKSGKPGVMKVIDTAKGADIRAVIALLSVNDEATATILCDSIISHIPASQLEQAMKMQAWLKAGKKIVMQVSVVSIIPEDEYREQMRKEMDSALAAEEKSTAKETPTDDKTLNAYFKKHGIKPKKTASGVYYTIEKPGVGAPISAGQSVSMTYKGSVLNGKPFDLNVGVKGSTVQEPLVYKVGHGDMIAGLDDGVRMLKKGSHATFYIPSALGYSNSSPMPSIPPNSILVFNVVVLDVK